tara:strand:+ start:389 stop:1660 length:1272 start_codon:yes stop_codon:yes gene_type:complete
MKKVLIISYYWPPFGGSGVQRWLKFVKYLPENRWLPFVYTPENPFFGVDDATLLKDIPNEVEIWKTPIWEPYALKEKLFGKGEKNQSAGVIANKISFKNRLLNWVRGNMFIPDPKVYWVRPSIDFLFNKIKEEGIEYIITTGPPHSMHLIGLGLKRIMPDLKWIVDFRDPWSELDLLDEFSLTYISRRKHQKMEREVLENSDIALTVSESWANDLKRLGAKNVELITNGYDIDDFQINSIKGDKFIIGHYGLLNHLRNPRQLWKALDCLCKENSDFNEKLEIHLSGNIDVHVLEEIKSYPLLLSKVKQLGYIPHNQIIERYHQASVLLLLLFNSKSGLGNYPAKIFEYFAVKKPILAFGPKNSDVERLMQSTDSGIYYSYNDKEIRDGILTLFEKKHNFKFENTERFSRKRLTEELTALLNNI